MTPDIGLAQINPTLGDLAGNCDKIFEVWEKLENDGAQICVFSELCVTGYPPEDLVTKPAFLDAVETEVAKLCNKTTEMGSAAIIGAPWRIGGGLYNCALWIQDGAIKHFIPKYTLPTYGVFDEDRIFKHGDLPQPIEAFGSKFGVMVCEDMWFEDVSAHLKSQGAECLIVINGSPFDVFKQDIRHKLAKIRNAETGLPIVYVNQVGGQDELVFDGGSFVYDADGVLMTQLKSFSEDFAVLKDERIEIFPQELEAIYEALCLGLKDYISKNNFPSVLIGLSGGIDSALSVVIAVDALGADNVHCVMMPSPFTSQESLTDAKELSEILGVQYDIMPIEDAMKSFDKTLSQPSDIAKENIQSRIRGLMLMALSNTNGKMVLSTGNKSEMAVGYATLYGDMCGGYNVLKDVYKTLVYDLSKWVNRETIRIPENIITKAPSAELKPDQTDQDSLPDYDTLDAILENLIEHERSLEEIEKQGYDRETILKVWSLLDRSEYKRRQAPPGVKITPKAFGKDRRYPITNQFLKNLKD